MSIDTTEQTTPDPTPSGSFRLEEIEAFRSLEGEQLADVTYYFWFNTEAPNQRFIYYIEVLFNSDSALLLSSGEDSNAIQVTDAMSLIQQARVLMERNSGKPAIQQLNASSSAIWKPLMGQTLSGVRLTKNEAGLYDNDALLLDFEQGGIVVALHDGGGLAISAMGEG